MMKRTILISVAAVSLLALAACADPCSSAGVTNCRIDAPNGNAGSMTFYDADTGKEVGRWGAFPGHK